MKLLNLEANLFYSDLNNAFNHAKATNRKVGIFEVLFDIEYKNYLSLEREIKNKQDLEEWMLDESHFLYKVKTEDDVMAVFEELKDNGTIEFDDSIDEIEYGIVMGKLIENIKTLKTDESFIIDCYMDVITKTPLEKLKYVFDGKIFVIGVY